VRLNTQIGVALDYGNKTSATIIFSCQFLSDVYVYSYAIKISKYLCGTVVESSLLLDREGMDVTGNSCLVQFRLCGPGDNLSSFNFT